MNIEETDFRTPVLACGDRLGYVHVGENFRGSLGTGTVDFPQLFAALAEVGYNGTITSRASRRPSSTPACRAHSASGATSGATARTWLAKHAASSPTRSNRPPAPRPSDLGHSAPPYRRRTAERTSCAPPFGWLTRRYAVQTPGALGERAVGALTRAGLASCAHVSRRSRRHAGRPRPTGCPRPRLLERDAVEPAVLALVLTHRPDRAIRRHSDLADVRALEIPGPRAATLGPRT